MKIVASTLKKVLPVVLALGAPPQGLAADKQIEAEQCVSLARIQRTKVVDDRNILFHMKNGDVYRNELPHKCPGLAANDAFMYRTSLTQLCNVDIITVLTNIGFGFSPGASCGLGMFYPDGPRIPDEMLEQETAEEILEGNAAKQD